MTAPRQVALGDVAVIERDIVDPAAIENGTLYVGLENIESGGRFVGVRPVDAGELASSKFAFSPQHLLYGKLRPYLAKIARPDFDGICSTDILPVLPGPDLDRGYLAWLLLTPEMVALSASRATGANLPRLSPTALAELKVPLPALAEQRRIAEILDKADTLRAKRRAALAQLDTLTQSIFLDMFGDPATNPKGLRKQPLGELIKLKSGDFLPATAMAESGSFPVFGGNGISGFHDQYTFEQPQIIVGRVGAYCGCVHVSPGKSWITDNALYVSDRHPDLLFDYLVHALTHAHLNQYASQFGQPLVSGSRIYPVPVLVPPRKAQQEFAAHAARSTELKGAHSRSLSQFEALFASLQHRAFRGEL
jgi:type I restriction enzyme, S subunit